MVASSALLLALYTNCYGQVGCGPSTPKFVKQGVTNEVRATALRSLSTLGTSVSATDTTIDSFHDLLQSLSDAALPFPFPYFIIFFIILCWLICVLLIPKELCKWLHRTQVHECVTSVDHSDLVKIPESTESWILPHVLVTWFKQSLSHDKKDHPTTTKK